MKSPRNKLYSYNESTCRYEEAVPTRAERAWRWGIRLFVVGAAMLAGLAWYQWHYLPAKAAQLAAEEEALKQELHHISQKLEEHEAMLADVYDRLNILYLPVVDAPAIPEHHWEAGQGGSAHFLPGQQTHTQRTQQRISLAKHRLNLVRANIEKVASEALDKSESLRRIPSLMPVENGIYMSGFGVRTHPITGKPKFHDGVDWSCAPGTPIYASADGRIEWSGDSQNGYGIHIDINHGNGFSSRYAHLSKVKVQEGHEVKRGDLIGWSGNSGMSTGPHLHYEVHRNGVKVDPNKYYYSDLLPRDLRRMDQIRHSLD